jgi:hypothetical protein
MKIQAYSGLEGKHTSRNCRAVKWDGAPAGGRKGINGYQNNFQLQNADGDTNSANQAKAC